jgi:hypothetical protein
VRKLLRELSRVCIIYCVELVSTIAWPSLLVEKMIRLLSIKKQENVRSIL